MKIKLLEYQHELREALVENDVVVVEKSRRTGYSWGASWVATEYAAKPKYEGGMNVYYMGYNLEMAREFIEYVGEDGKYLELGASAIGETLFGDVNDPDNQVKAFRVDFKHGRVVALPSKPRSLRGMQGLVILDEAAFHEDLAELLKAALALTIWGGKVLIISTHDGEDNPFNELIQDIRAGKFPYKLSRCDFNRAIAEGLYKRICERTEREWSQEAEDEWREDIVKSYGDGADEELFCIPSKSSGSWLNLNRIESCTNPEIPLLTWEPPANDFVDWPIDTAYRDVRDWMQANVDPLLEVLPKDKCHYLGEDFGRSGDLSVDWPAVRMPDYSLDTPFVLQLRNAPFRTQEQILFYLLDRFPKMSGAAFDARGNGQAIAEYARQRYGHELIAEVMLSAAWYRENMPRLKTSFEDRTFSIPKHEDIIDDFRGIKLRNGVACPPESRTKTETGQRHCDSAIAAALVQFAAATIERPQEWEEPITAGSSHTASMIRGYK